MGLWQLSSVQACSAGNVRSQRAFDRRARRKFRKRRNQFGLKTFVCTGKLAPRDIHTLKMAVGAKAELIDEHVSAHQCKLALEALLKHEVKRHAEQQESQLLPGREQNVWLVVTVKQMHPEKKLKPHRIPIVHPIVDPRTSAVCLITKDPQREYKDLLEEKQIRFISRVVGVEKLKGKFKGFEERRMLLKENDLFLADERVIPLLPGLLGKKFFAAKKQPIPVCLTRKDLKSELERAISSTYFHQNQGTCSSIKVGTLSQQAIHVLANLKAALPAVAKAIKGGWDNIQSLHIKTNSSISLPIWTCELGAEEGGRWDGLVDVEMGDAKEASGEEDGSEDEVEDAPPKKKGKKRAAEDDEEKPKKKAKSSVEEVETKKHAPTKATKAVPPAEADTPASSLPFTSAPKSKRRKEAVIPAEVVSEIPTPAPTAPSSDVTPATAEASAPSDTNGKKKARHRKSKATARGDRILLRPTSACRVSNPASR
ncbi:hypothetical protein NM688_g9185 [Phlebia brevispora]|uniref:Uncharacterized protein n=1 Tax=Phlebia brevispora TaxID=194682 RepID=A0ACC1RIL1_9APHY|nr:hypothetical protein NM688_g9185 [Phlebia brevispora]